MNDCLSTCNILKAAASCCERVLNEALSEHEISHCQATILLALESGPVSMSALSKEMCCHKSNVTQVVAGLTKKGLVERGEALQDKRVINIKPTAKGKSIAVKLRSVLSHSAEGCMDVFTQAEKKVFTELLQKYVSRNR